jgi:hypothetical protein
VVVEYGGTGNTVKKADGECAAVVAVSEILTRLMSLAFSLSFIYDFFITLTS